MWAYPHVGILTCGYDFEVGRAKIRRGPEAAGSSSVLRCSEVRFRSRSAGDEHDGAEDGAGHAEERGPRDPAELGAGHRAHAEDLHPQVVEQLAAGAAVELGDELLRRAVGQDGLPEHVPRAEV